MDVKNVSKLTLVLIISTVSLLFLSYYLYNKSADKSIEIERLTQTIKDNKEFYTKDVEGFNKRFDEIDKKYNEDLLAVYNGSRVIRLSNGITLRPKTNREDVKQGDKSSNDIRKDILDLGREVRECKEIVDEWRFWYNKYLNEDNR